MSVRTSFPLSPPVPPAADISDVVNRYLPQSPAPNTPVAAPTVHSQNALQGDPLNTNVSTRTPSRESSQAAHVSPYSRAERNAVNAEAELLAERAFNRASKPMLVQTPDSRLLSRGICSASSETRYPAAYNTPRSPNSAEFRTRYADPTPDDLLQSLRNRVEEMESYEANYSKDVDVFRKQAEIDRREKSGLLANVQKLRAQVVAVEDSKEAIEAERQLAIQRRDEDCNRKILNMRKSLLITEQSLGSLRTEKEELAAKAAALDVQREECEVLRRQIFQQNQNMTLLAQQNEQLQRALKRKENDVQADLDVYVKQLDLVQQQAAASKKEAEVMAIRLRAQETLEQEIESLRQQNLELQAAINDVDKEATQLDEKHLMALQEKDDECAREVVNYRRQIEGLQKQVDSLQLQNQHLLNKHRPQQITEEINRLAGQAQMLADELDQKNRQNEAFQRALIRKDEERIADVSELQKNLDAVQSRANTLAGDLRSSQIVNERLESEVNTFRARVDDIRAERDKIEAEMHSKCRELQCQLDVYSHRANTNQNEADTVKALAAAMEEKHRASFEVLQATHQAELREALKRKDEQYAEVITDHVKQLEISSRLTASVRSDNANLSAEVAKLSSAITQLEPLKSRVASLEQLLAAREEEAANDLQTFNAQADGLTRELNQVRTERDDARADVFALEQQVAELKQLVDSIPELEAELQTVREKVIDMNAKAIGAEKAHAAQVDDLQTQIAFYEKQLTEKAVSSTRELELAVKQRQLAAENEKLKDIVRQQLEQAPTPMLSSPPREILSPSAAPIPAEPLNDQVSQSLRARTGSPGIIMNVDEHTGQQVAAPRVPPLELSKALHSPVQYLNRGGSMYDTSTVRSEESLQPMPVARAGSEETVDSLLQGHPIAYGNQPQNSMHFEPLPRLFEQTATLIGEVVAVRYEKRQGEWEDITWRQYYLRSFQFAKALVAEEIRPFQGVVICAANSPEWMSAFCGTIFAGGLPVACHPGWGPRHCFRIASESNAHVVLVDSGKSLQKFLALKDQLPTVKHIVLFRETVPPALKSLHGDFILNFDQFMARANHATDESIAQRGDNIMVEHAAAVLYTSGSLGEPKGCVLSHDNLCFTAHSLMMTHFQDQAKPTLMSFSLFGEPIGVVLEIVLPMLYGCHRRDSAIVCIPKSGAGSVVSSLREGKPTFVAAPPHVISEIASELAAAPKSEGDQKLAAWAGKVSLEASRNRQDLADIAQVKGAGMAQQVNERIRQTVGLDRCPHILGLGPVSVSVCEQLAQLGIDVLESYGCAEATGFITTGSNFHYRFGTAGVRLPGTELKIDLSEGLPQRKEGEILVRGRNVMLGYLGNDELTQRTIDNDGWLKTADLGKVDDMNLLTVTGRLKELFTTNSGERISPAIIESELKRQCSVLSNVIVIGDRRKYVVALVTLKCKKNPDTGAWTDELADEARAINPDVLTVTTARRDKKWLDYIAQIVSIYNTQAISSLHKVRRFCILSSDISSEEMTPTKKIKRQLVTDRCINIIEKLYAEDSPRSTATTK